MRIRGGLGKSMFWRGVYGLVLMFTVSPLLAQESAGPKVGVFDGERVLAESEMG